LIKIDHGVSSFSVSKGSQVHSVLESLVLDGAIDKWDEAETGIPYSIFENDDEDSSSTSSCVPSASQRYIPTSAGIGSVPAALLSRSKIPTTLRYSTLVKSIDRVNEKWVLNNDTDDPFDLLVCSTVTPAHPRWTSIYPGTTPPLVSLDYPLIDDIKGVETEGVVVVMFVVPESEAGRFEGIVGREFVPSSSSILSRVTARKLGDGSVALVAHSTHEYAAANSKVHGSTSAASKLGAVNDKSKEQLLVSELVAELDARGLGPSAAPVYPPTLHRWGAAFVKPSTLVAGSGFIKDKGLLFVGDFMQGAGSGVERSMESAMRGASVLRDFVVDEVSK
jgi:hypothetical protein